MKSIHVTLILICLSVWSISLIGQSQFGVKIGANFSHIDENIDTDGAVGNAVGELVIENSYKVKVRPQIGVWFNFPLTDRLSLQPELLWTEKNLHAEDNNPEDGYINFQYFSLPVLANYQLGNWRIELGPELSFLLDQSLKDFANSLDESPFIEENVFEVAINIGVQYHYDRWRVGLRGSRDLTDFISFDFTDLNGEFAGTLRGFHQGLTLWAGYQIL